MKRIFLRTISFLTACMLLCSLCSVSATNDNGARLLAITFDDGPGKYTDKLLDGLKNIKAKATFFMVGTNVPKYPDTVKRMKSEGHQLATHTMSHANLPLNTSEAIKQEVRGVEERISSIVGQGKYYLRPPYGAFNDQVKQVVGTPMVHWSIDTEDWRYRDAGRVYDVIVNSAYDGAIILLHDLYESSVDGALQAITELKKQGYEFVTVEQLLRRRGITPQNGEVYFEAPNEGINLPAVVSPIIACRNTAAGSKVLIGRYAPSDILYFTEGNDKPDENCSKYLGGYYIKNKTSVSAIALSDNELSTVSSKIIIPRYSLSRSDLDKMFYRYSSMFLSFDKKFVIGMKI